MPKVREVFERAYGPVPDGATCHVGYSVPCEGVSICAAYDVEGRCYSSRGDDWEAFSFDESEGPDISDRDAEAFRGFFDAAYDAALDALTKAQPDYRTVIALADAMAVAEREYKVAPSEGSYMQAAEATKRFEEASREFWASLSTDGTGESPVLSTHLDVMGKLYEQDETEDTIDDGFGNAWGKCRPDCGMYVVRPGKAACGYEGTTGCGFYPGDDVMGEGK